MFSFSVKTFDHPNTIYARLPRELSTTRPSDTIKWALVNQDGDIEKNPDGTESLEHGEDSHEPEEAHDQARILSQVDRLDEHKTNNDLGADPKQDDKPHYHVKMTLLRSLHHGGDSHESEEYKLAEERGQNEWQNNDETEEWDQTEGNNENDEKDLYQVRNLDQDMGSSEENDDDKNEMIHGHLRQLDQGGPSHEYEELDQNQDHQVEDRDQNGNDKDMDFDDQM